MYPATHQKYANLMLQNGGLISENIFGTQPQRNLFLNRNRIIAGMSDAVIIVESALKGGAMGTVEYANNYHRDVFAVPGNLKNPYSEGCNALIQRNKASIYTSVQNIIEALNWDLENQQTQSKEKELALNNFTEEESKVVSLLRQHTEMHIDDLAWQSQIPVNRLASVLLSLEFQGFVKASAGKKFRLV
jgi:DNA processing protein